MESIRNYGITLGTPLTKLNNSDNASTSVVREIMTEFADLTGLSSADKIPRRYLWTDAFAVCNFLELYRQMSNESYKHLALRLVDQVHNTLGRHREDDPRTSWISGLDEQDGKIHPTKIKYKKSLFGGASIRKISLVCQEKRDHNI